MEGDSKHGKGHRVEKLPGDRRGWCCFMFSLLYTDADPAGPCLWPRAIPFQGCFRRVGILRICPAIQILLSVGGMSKMEHFRLKFQTPGCKPKNGGFLRSLLSLTQGFSNISSLPQPKLRSLCHALLFIPLLIIKLLFRIWEIELLLDHCRFMWHSNTSLTQPTKPAKEHRMSRSTKHRQQWLNCYSLYIVY